MSNILMSRPSQLILQINYALATGEMEAYQMFGMGTTAVSIIFMLFTKSTLLFVANKIVEVAPQMSRSLRRISYVEDSGDAGVCAEATRTDNEQLATENDTLRFDKEALEADNLALKTYAAETKRDNEGLKTNVSELNTNVAELKRDNEGLKTEVERLRDENAELKKLTERLT